MNYRPMVYVDRQWVGNALAFAAREEAENYVRQLAWSWTSVADFRVDEIDAPVNHTFTNGKLERVNIG